MSLYRSRDQRIADEVIDAHMACGFCKKLTLIETLSQYGGRCFECYESYCRFGAPENRNRLTLEEKKAILDKLRSMTNPTPLEAKAWAHKLRAREESGEKLSRLQRDAWREALRELPGVSE